MSVPVRLSELIKRQLLVQVDYIEAAGQPAAADRLENAVRETCDVLSHFPTAGHACEETMCPNIREFKVKGFPALLYYRFDGKIVEVIAMNYGGQGPASVKRMLE